jgi:Mg-chelatase subunit ChlD
MDDLELSERFEKSKKGRAKAQKKMVAYKTVDTFAGITQRKLWLKEGPSAQTDGHAISVPFEDPDFYRLVEHELAHILFRSDAIAREKFLDDYVGKVGQVAQKAGVKIDVSDFRKMMGMMINVIEDKRINSLWGQLYPGSAEQIMGKVAKDVAPFTEAAQFSLVPYIGCLYGGIDVSAPKFDRFKPFILEALKKVERKGFAATLAVTKWLVTQLVSDLIRQARQEQAPQPDDNGEEGEGQESQEGAEGSGGDSDGEGDSDEKEQKQGGGGGQWYPPPVDDASIEQRAQALADLLGGGGGPDKVTQSMDDFQPPRFPSKQETLQAERTAEHVTGMNVNKEETMKDFLEGTEKQMDEIIATAQSAMRQEMNEDEWLRKDAMAKVVFKDVKKTDAVQKIELDAEDQNAVQRLRAHFYRVMGKRKTSLSDTGSEIDIRAYIEMKAMRQPAPIFKHEERGQGFKAVVLIDRSGSMGGEKTYQAERACRIIAKAMKFPFVDLQVWGFKSTDNGQVDIDRYDPQIAGYSSSTAQVGGTTPLHIATKVACRFLESGDETKHLFVLTDGFPVYSRRDGKDFPTWQLMMYTRESILGARKSGVGVTGVCLGYEGYAGGAPQYDLTPKQMSFVFGHQRNWRMMTPSRLGSDLVKLVSTSFTSYLKSQ